MDYKFNFSYGGQGFKVELKNEFERLVSWSWNSNIYAAVLETVTWQLKQSPGDSRDIVKALLDLDIKEIETSLKMESLKQEAGEKKEIYFRA